MSDPQSGAELLARIRPVKREESTYLCLRPDLLDAWEEANTQLAASQVNDAAGARLSSKSSEATTELAERVAAIEEEIEATQVKFTMRAMSKDQWQALCDIHPPRKGNELDLFAGYNRDAVVDAAIRECLIDPVFDDASWREFIELCNPSEWNELRRLQTSVNRPVVETPKSPLASRILGRRGTD